MSTKFACEVIVCALFVSSGQFLLGNDCFSFAKQVIYGFFTFVVAFLIRVFCSNQKVGLPILLGPSFYFTQLAHLPAFTNLRSVVLYETFKMQSAYGYII